MTFVTRSHRRVIEHCDELLAQALPDAERSRLIETRNAAEAEYETWRSGRLKSEARR